MTGYVLMLGGAAIQWASRRQPIVTKSTMAAEYVAASQATDELMHVCKLLHDFGVGTTPVLLRQDNQSTARSLVNPIEDGKTKYLQVRFRYVRERVASGEIAVEWVDSRRMLADMFTKPLQRAKLPEMSAELGLVGGTEV